MAWPSGTKAGTTNVDAGTDKPSLARADIKQNIDNVNAIIDEFNISSPSDGDLLQYSSTSGQWEQVAASSVGSSLAISKFGLVAGGSQLVSGNTYRREITVDYDGASIITASTYTFDLGAGTYMIEPVDASTSDSSEFTVILFNEDTSSNTTSFGWIPYGATDGQAFLYGNTVFTIASTTTFSFRQTGISANDRNADPYFKLIKL